MGRKRTKKQAGGQLAENVLSNAESAQNIVGTYEISTGTAEVEADDYRDGAYVLLVNGVPSSHIVPGSPRELEFEYMRWIAAGVEHIVSTHPELNEDKLRLTHLGGGACTMACYFADLWPKSRNTVVELDAKLGELVRRLFDIPKSPRVKIRAGEARTETDGFVPASRDVIIRDVFAGSTTPHNLTTVEFFNAAHRSLSAGGLYVANCGDHSDLSGAKAEIAGLTRVFAHVACIADPPMLKGRRYGNIILLASDSPLPAADSSEAAQLTKALLGGAVPAHYKDETWTRKMSGGASPRHDKAEMGLAEQPQ